MAKNLNDSINMEVKEAGVCTKEFTFSINADAAKSESAKVLNSIAGMVQLPGFRAGKAPVGMVSKKYAAEIVDELRSRYLSAAAAEGIAALMEAELPVYFVGVGEQKEDLQVFNAKEYAEAIF